MMRRKIVYAVLLILIGSGLYYADSVVLRLRLMTLSVDKSINQNEYVFSFSGYDCYNYRFEGSESALKKDYLYAKRYLRDKLRVEPVYYSDEDYGDYYVVWQFKDGYYLLGSIFDLGYKGFFLAKRKGLFIEDSKYASSELRHLNNHQSVFQ